MDQSAISAAAFHNLAEKYRDQYMDLTVYDASYAAFCDLLPAGRASVLDAACGPGNVSRYLLTRRGELDLLGIDLAPRMVELARAAAPSARFMVQDCRHLTDLYRQFDGIICAFGLPYLSPEEASRFIGAAAQVLRPGGVLYLSTILGGPDAPGVYQYTADDRIYVNYHPEDQVQSWLQANRFSVAYQSRAPSSNSNATADLVVIAVRAQLNGNVVKGGSSRT